jgi:hypothetical protein
VAFITDTAESDFRYEQAADSAILELKLIRTAT